MEKVPYLPTLKAKVVYYCMDLGLSLSDANNVLDATIAAIPEMAGRWEDAPEDYPTPLFTLLTMEVREQARLYLVTLGRPLPDRLIRGRAGWSEI